MSFAVKLTKQQKAILKAQTPTWLTLTNICLAPTSETVSLFLRSRQDQSLILVTKLSKGRNEAYHCQIKMQLSQDISEEIVAAQGEAHLIGHIQRIGPDIGNESKESPNIIVEKEHISKESQEYQSLLKALKDKSKGEDKGQNQEAKSQSESKKVLEKINQPENSRPRRSVRKPVEKKAQQVQEDDDDEDQQQQQEGRSAKKDKGWAALLNGADNQEDQDGEYSEQSQQQSDDDDEDDDDYKQVTKKNSPKRKCEKDQEEIDDVPKKKIKTEEQAAPIVRSKRLQEKKQEESKEQVIKHPHPAPPLRSDSESSSFQFDKPQGLPAFMGNK